jgi:PAS domain S-box-containing protein
MTNETLWFAAVFMAAMVWQQWRLRYWRAATAEAEQRARLLKAVQQHTGALSGEAFLHKSLDFLAAELKLSHVFIAEIRDDDAEHLHLFSLRVDGQDYPGFCYALSASPCAQVLSAGSVYYRAGIAEVFPQHVWLAQEHIAAYAGVSLCDDNGAPIAVLTVMDRAPFSQAAPIQNLLELLRGRLGVELARLRRERKLRQNQDLLQAISHNATTLMFVRDSAGRFLMVNPIYAALLHTDAENLRGHTLADYFPPASVAIQAESDRLVLQHGGSLTREETLMFAEGERTLLTARFPLYKENGEIYAVGGVCSDITARRHTEEQLRKLSQAVEQSASVIVITNDQGVIEFVNPAFSRVTGYEACEALGQNPRILQSGETPLSVFTQLWRTLCAGGTWQGELINRKKNGEIYWEYATISPVRGREGITHFVAVKEDITQRKLAEEALKAAKEAAEQASRSKSEFLANMSHEIRTPMNAILGFAEILNGQVTDKVHRTYLSAIISSGRSLLGLINDILDLSKIEAGKLSLSIHPVRMRLLFTEMETVFAQKIAENHLRWQVRIDSALPELLESDETRLRQILFNLVGNAVKFTENGEVNVCVSVEKSSATQCRLYFAVRDTGIGIDAREQEKVFGAFEQQAGQNHSQYGGTGLGLAITHRLVSMLNGEITLSSASGMGCTFIVCLCDVKICDVAPIRQESFDSNAISFAPATVLIADDIRLNRVLLRGFLQRSPLRFIEAENGLQALALARAEKPDVVLMDLKMPHMDGQTAVQQFKQDPLLREIPVIAVTAAAMKSTEEAFGSVCDAFVRKPVSKEDIVRTLMRFLPYTHHHKSAPALAETPMLVPPTNLPELRKVVMTHLLPQWKPLSATSAINDLEDFGREVRELGLRYGYLPLHQWGEELYNEASVFNIVALPKILARFPALIATLEDQV